MKDMLSKTAVQIASKGDEHERFVSEREPSEGNSIEAVCEDRHQG